MSKQGGLLAAFAAAAPPAILLGGGFAGSLISEELANYPQLHVGLISFGVRSAPASTCLLPASYLMKPLGGHRVRFGACLLQVAALLYLVTEELLLEAHHGPAGHDWRIDVFFFVGFLGSLLLGKFVDAAVDVGEMPEEVYTAAYPLSTARPEGVYRLTTYGA